MFYLGNGFSASDTVHFELDMRELKSQLQDEKRYSVELKKELDGLYNLIAKQVETSGVCLPQILFLFTGSERAVNF